MKKIFIILFTPLVCFLNAQISNGIIEYKISNNANFDNPQLKELYNKEDQMISKELVMELKFDKKKSSFGPIPLPIFTNEQIESAIIGSHLTGFYLRDLGTNIINFYKDDSDFGQINIQYPTLLNWQLTDETKTIGNYTCYKATTTITDYNFIKTPTSVITVWYCPDIPVSLGPKRLSGLPGLILESTEKDVTLQVTKLNFNVDKKLEFKEPFIGKKITPEEFKKLIDEYIEEMMKE